MNELVRVNYENGDRPTVMGRELHEALGIKTRYNDWFARMCEYGFAENSDYIALTQKRVTNNPKNPTTTQTDHQITIEMAKEICMIQRSDIGRKCREYFIGLEKLWNSPEATMKRALEFANRKMIELQEKSVLLETKIAEDKPKVDYYDTICDSGMLTTIRDTAKELHMGQKEFTTFLMNKKLLYKTKDGLRPYMKYAKEGWFEVKDRITKTNIAVRQTYVTVNGKKKLKMMMD